MGVRLLHVADLHLGSPFSEFDEVAAGRRQDLLETFRRICDLAIERRVAAVLVAGDLFDSFNPSRSLVDAVYQRLSRLADTGITTFIAPGDHDSSWYQRSVWSKSPFSATHVFRDATFSHPVSIDVEGVDLHVHGLAYNPLICPDPISSLSPRPNGINVAILHATVDASEDASQEDRHLAVSRLQLFHSGVQYFALGHVHHRHVYEHGPQAKACYPGSPEGLHPGETGPRWATLVDIDGDQSRLEFIPVNVREVRAERINVTGMSHEQVTDTVRRLSNEDVLLNVRLVGSPAELLNAQRLEEKLANHFFWIQVDDATKVSSSDFVERLAVDGTVTGRFVRRMRRQIASSGDADERVLVESALKTGLTFLQDRVPQ